MNINPGRPWPTRPWGSDRICIHNQAQHCPLASLGSVSCQRSNLLVQVPLPQPSIWLQAAKLCSTNIYWMTDWRYTKQIATSVVRAVMSIPPHKLSQQREARQGRWVPVMGPRQGGLGDGRRASWETRHLSCWSPPLFNCLPLGSALLFNPSRPQLPGWVPDVWWGDLENRMALHVRAEPGVGSILCEVFLALHGSPQGLLFLQNHFPLSLYKFLI